MPEQSIDTISELFARDPFQHTKQDIDNLIEYYAARRKEFALSGKSMPKVEKPKADLADLGLV